MSAEPPTGDSSTHPGAEQFFANAVRRIPKFLLTISALALLPVAWAFGFLAVAGFASGALVSWFNFRALARGVEALGDRIVEQHSRERGHVVVMRFLLRYLLVAAIGYGIFQGSLGAFRGFLFGVCAPVPAMLMEAAYEAYAALRRGY